MASSAVFQLPEDKLLNDFLMRLRPFLFTQDMFFWKHMLFRLHQDVTVDTGYLRGLFEAVATRFNGTNLT
jgi:hypothetical protein